MWHKYQENSFSLNCYIVPLFHWTTLGVSHFLFVQWQKKKEEKHFNFWNSPEINPESVQTTDIYYTLQWSCEGYGECPSCPCPNNPESPRTQCAGRAVERGLPVIHTRTNTSSWLLSKSLDELQALYFKVSFTISSVNHMCNCAVHSVSRLWTTMDDLGKL